MPIQLHRPGVSNAAALIRAGKVNTGSSWSMSAADENAIKGDPPNWTEFGRWHLGRNTDAAKDVKDGWRYPFGKRGSVYRSGLIAIRQRAGQQGHTAIYEEAGKLRDKIDKRERLDIDEQRRYLPPAEVRKTEDGKTVLVGFIPYNEETVIGGFFREVIRPGFFDRALKEKQDVLARYNHKDAVPPLGRTSNKTLRLEVRKDGLHYEIEPPDTEAARGIIIGIDRGDIPHSSFRFVPKSVRESGQTWTDGGGEKLPLRELLDIARLIDVSPVDSGQYKGSAADVRSAEMIHEDYVRWKDEQAPSDGGGRSEHWLEAERRLLDVTEAELEMGD